MHHTVSVLAAVALAAAPVLAQDPPDMSPAKEVQKLAVLVGTWEGAGEVTHAPDVPAERWTSKSSCKWVLGGHFVREDARIKMASMPTPLEFISLYGWDRENQRYVQIEVSNMGGVRLNELHITGDGKMVTASTSVEMGEPVVERWVTEIDGNQMTFSGHRAQGSGAFYEMVSGTADRTDKKPSQVDIVNAAFMPDMMTAPAKAIAKLDGAVGQYKMKGWFVPAPGTPKMDFTGTEIVQKIFGGTVLEGVSKGDPMPNMPDYEGLSWIGWNAHDNCYDMVYANNMGEVNLQQGHKQGNKIIMTFAGRYMGQPVSARGVIELAEDGSFQTATGHHITGAMEPMQVFEGLYTKQ